MFDHTNDALPSDLIVKREGDFLILKTRTATIRLFAEQWMEIVSAIREVSPDHTHIRLGEQRSP